MRKARRKIKSGFEDRARQSFLDKNIPARYEVTTLKYTVEATYRPDFTFTTPCGHTFYIETKGYFDSDDRRKMANVKRCNPDLDIRIWFQKDGYLTKAKSSRYSDWARKHKYEYWVGEDFPEHWFQQHWFGD